MALARGAALASANAPLFAASTAALAYALDPGTGELSPWAFTPSYLDVSANADLGESALAYSALADETAGTESSPRRGRPLLLAGSLLAALGAIGVGVAAVSLVSDQADVHSAAAPGRERRHPGSSAGSGSGSPAAAGPRQAARGAAAWAQRSVVDTPNSGRCPAACGGASSSTHGEDGARGTCLSRADPASARGRASARAPGTGAGRSASAGRGARTPAGITGGAQSAAAHDVPASSIRHDSDSDQPTAHRRPRRQGRSRSTHCGPTRIRGLSFSS